MPFEAVIWDMGGVILRTEDRSSRLRWEERLGLNEGKLDSIVFDGRASRLASVGKADEDQVWEEVREALGLENDELDQFREDFWRGDAVDEELLDYIRELKKDCKTALLSNAWPNVRSVIEGEWEFADAFDELVISAEVGLVKPDPRIYRLALDRLSIVPEAAIFIDDFAENVESAKELGLAGIVFKSTSQAMNEVDGLLSRLD